MANEAFLERCRAIAVCTWSDALDQIGMAGVVRGLTRRCGRGAFAGVAATVKQTTGKLGSFDRADFAVGRMVDSVRPGDVLVVDMGGADISTIGGNAALAAKRNGAAAVLVDGGCRDLDEIEHMGLWLASRHLTPITGKRRVKVESMGEPVQLGGVTVQQGDIVIGDDTGIIVVPSGDSARALAKAEEMHAVDVKLEEGLKAGLSFAEAARAANYL